MFIIADVLLFFTTSLVLSITALCLLTFIRARDQYSAEFLSILIPLSLQMILTQFVTYLHRLYPEMIVNNTNYKLFAFWVTGASIVFTTLLLYTAARYLIRLLPTTAKQTSIALLIMRIIIILFFATSIVLIGYFSNWEIVMAMKITFSYHFFAGSYVMVILGISALYYKRFAKGWETENLLSGIIATFCPLLFTFPVDLIFFRNQNFKIAYLSYSVFVVYLYYFIARRYFQEYEHPVEDKKIHDGYLNSKGISVREKEILLLLIKGNTSHEIATELFISHNTVKTHIKHIYEKLHVSTRVQLFSLLSENGKKQVKK